LVWLGAFTAAFAAAFAFADLRWPIAAAAGFAAAAAVLRIATPLVMLPGPPGICGYLRAERADYKFRVRYQEELAATRVLREYQVQKLMMILQHPDEDVEEALATCRPLTAGDLRELAIWARSECFDQISDEAHPHRVSARTRQPVNDLVAVTASSQSHSPLSRISCCHHG